MIGERLDVLPDCITTLDQPLTICPSSDCEPLVRRLVLAPYSAIRLGIHPLLKYQGESHHSLQYYRPSSQPDFENRLTAIFFLSPIRVSR